MVAVVVFSGGQDSTTCLYEAKHKYGEVHAVTFDYGQRHRREIVAAQLIAMYAGVSHEVIHIGPNVLKSTSPLVSSSELEQYKDHNSLPGGLEKTFVPMRNQLFLTIAANRAYGLGSNVVVTGVSAEDFGGYPDCRPEFIRAFELVSKYGTFTGETDTLPPLRVETPLMRKNKAETVQMVFQYPGCYEALALSHTAYDGAFPPTGMDHATLLRAKGFEEAGVPDPLWLRYALTQPEGELEDHLPDHPIYDLNNAAEYVMRINEVVQWMDSHDL